MRETAIERYLVRRCHEEGFECWKFVRPGRRNAFDRVVPLLHRCVIWIETKRTSKDLTPAQRRERVFLESLGHVALCINSRAAVEQFVETYLL